MNCFKSIILLLTLYISGITSKVIIDQGPICSQDIINLGYSCCKSKNCMVIRKDNYGTWGKENNKWCGCTPECHYEVHLQGYQCCKSNNCKVIYEEKIKKENNGKVKPIKPNLFEDNINSSVIEFKNEPNKNS
ncbi:Non-catalytic module family DOC2 [Piromyces sp. E2]|nr:Non-catalytic module family DOC2 [Piromyces sp. E2]|eukprot:OUM60616.1 Non-catalytic module family DOC2 [Piromyces sp. E2]